MSDTAFVPPSLVHPEALIHHILPLSMTSLSDVLSRATLATLGAWTFRSFSRPSSILSSLPQCRCSSWRRAEAKASWDLFRRSLIWDDMFLASLKRRNSKICILFWICYMAILFFSLKNTNFVEDIEILLLVKFRLILFRGFRGDVENVSANQRPGWPSYFSNRPEKHKFGRGHWDHAFCQVLLKSIQQLQRRSRKWLSQSEARAANLFFWSARKKTNLEEDIEIFVPCKFCWILFSGFRGEVENISANQRPGRPFCFSDWPEKHEIVKGSWDLASY